MFKNVSVPRQWVGILRALQTTLPTPAILHGGALRDLTLGKTERVKDLDIAVCVPKHYEGHYANFVLYKLYDALGWKHVERKKRQAHTYMNVPNLVTVIDFEHPSFGIPVQICLYDYSENWFGRTIINNNDFGMNQVGFDGNKFLYTPAFERDVSTKTFTALKFKVRGQAENAIKRANDWKYSGAFKGFNFDVSRAHRFLKDNPEVEVATGDTFAELFN